MIPEHTESAINTLEGPDGSATYSSNGHTVIAAVNGPIEVSRRDEQPEESTLEVNVRPASGVGGPRDRHLELLLHSTLSRIISIETFPRSLIQLTLQILATPPSVDTLPPPFEQSILLSLPSLLNASLLSLISGAIPLCTTIETFLAFTIRGSDKPHLVQSHQSKLDLSQDVKKNIVAVHVLAITGTGELALSESEGDFDFEDWKAVCLAVRARVNRTENGTGMDVDGAVVDGRQWLSDLVGKANGSLAT